jgi:hypothetical protein
MVNTSYISAVRYVYIHYCFFIIILFPPGVKHLQNGLDETGHCRIVAVTRHRNLNVEKNTKETTKNQKEN